MRQVSRHFPDHGWAWPDDGLDQLLKAALLVDDVALIQAENWLANHNIETAGFREHRLLAAIAHRFGKKLSAHSAYPRLVGLQKMLWSRSRFAMREAEPVLKALVGQGCAVMLIKGAARIALDATAQKGRVAHDVDFLVRPRDMVTAFETICGFGWKPATGSSSHALADRVPWIRSLNFQKGEFGDLDLHQFAFHPPHFSRVEDERVWGRAVGASFSEVPVQVPAASDRIAISVAHSGLDAHAHSDWLVDCDATLRDGTIDWDALLETARIRSIALPTAIALTYLGQEIGAPVPSWVLGRLDELARRTAPWSRLSALLQAKPRGSYGRIVWLARGCAKLVRLRETGFAETPGHPPSTVVLRGRCRRAPSDPDSGHLGLRQSLVRRPDASKLTLTLRCMLPPIRRRVDFELRAKNRLVAHLRYRNHFARGGIFMLRFSADIPKDVGNEFTLEARPTQFLRSRSSAEDVAAFSAAPFAVASVVWT